MNQAPPSPSTLGRQSRTAARYLDQLANDLDRAVARALNWTPGHAARPSTEPTSRGGDTRDVGDQIIVGTPGTEPTDDSPGTPGTGRLAPLDDEHSRALANLRADLLTIEKAIRRIHINLRTFRTLDPATAQALADAIRAPGAPCANPSCGTWITGRRRQGRCDACYQYRRRTGTDRTHLQIHPEANPTCELCAPRTKPAPHLPDPPTGATVRPIKA